MTVFPYAERSLRPGARFGRSLRIYERCASTQDELKELARQGAPEGTTVLSRVQSAGRGRGGRSWASVEGCLMFSVLMRPRVDVERLAALPLVFGDALVRELVRRGALRVRLKWPNDIMGEGRKVGGLIVEGATSSGLAEELYLGVGLNVNTRVGSLPGELRDAATSLLEVLGTRLDEEALLAGLLERLEEAWLAYLEDGTGLLPAAVAGRISTLGRRVRIETEKETMEGLAEGVDPRGALLVRSDDGLLHTVLSARKVTEL